MQAEIISVGTELLLGQIVNSNAHYLCQKLGELGIDVYYITSVGDNAVRLKEILAIASARSDLIILSGGLGPTSDDITKETLAEFLDLPLELHSESLKTIECFFAKRGRKMKSSNEKQAFFPKGAKIIGNATGTAPGCIIESKGRIFVLLPGPPRELIPMFEKGVYGYLRSKSKEIILSKTIKIFGIGESAAEEKIKDIINNQRNPTVASLAGDGEVSFRITAKALSREKAHKLIVAVESAIKDKLQRYIYGNDEDTLEGVVAHELLSNNIPLAVAESCTGGLVSHMLTNVPGVSRIFKRGYVVYSADAKIDILKVPADYVTKYTAVSQQVATAMAIGALKAAKAKLAVATTGYAGPEGEEVGLVFVAVTDGSTTRVKRIQLAGDRKWIKLLAAKHALNELRLFLLHDSKNGK